MIRILPVADSGLSYPRQLAPLVRDRPHVRSSSSAAICGSAVRALPCLDLVHGDRTRPSFATLMKLPNAARPVRTVPIALQMPRPPSIRDQPTPTTPPLARSRSPQPRLLRFSALRSNLPVPSAAAGLREESARDLLNLHPPFEEALTPRSERAILHIDDRRALSPPLVVIPNTETSAIAGQGVAGGLDLAAASSRRADDDSFLRCDDDTYRLPSSTDVAVRDTLFVPAAGRFGRRIGADVWPPGDRDPPVSARPDIAIVRAKIASSTNVFSGRPSPAAGRLAAPKVVPPNASSRSAHNRSSAARR